MVLPGPVAQTAANQTLTKFFHGHLLAATHNQMPRNRDSSSSTDLAETQTGATGWVLIRTGGWMPLPCYILRGRSSPTNALSKVLFPNGESGGATQDRAGGSIGVQIRGRPRAAWDLVRVGGGGASWHEAVWRGLQQRYRIAYRISGRGW